MSQFNINKDRSVQADKVFLVDRLFNIIDNGEVYPVSDLQIVANLNSNWECSFTVYKETNGIVNPLWDKITDLALVKIENKGIFELDAPITDENCTYKQCHGNSICESETSQTIMSLEINTPDDIARVSETNPTDTYYEEFPTIFYRDLSDLSVFDRLNESNSTNAEKLQSLTVNEKTELLRKSSLLHRVFSEMPEYAMNINGTNIDESLKNLEYIFSWSDTSVYDICQDIAEEVQCIFIFDKFNRSFEVRDLRDHCEIDNCRDIENRICPICMQNGTTQKIVKFGEFSGVEIDTKNLAETLELTGDVNSVKNYFKIEGADDIITNRISNRLIGNGYLWKLGTLQKSQMSEDLVNAIDAREKMMADNNYQEIYDGLWDNRNALNEKILKYRSGMMPSPEMADENAEYVFHYLFGTNGKIDYAYASNRYQSQKQIIDSIMNYAKLLSPTNHTIEYIDTSLRYTETKWKNYDVVDTITFKVHIYLDGHYIDNDESKGYADEYTSSDITLEVAKGYDANYTDETNTVIYTNDYYKYLKRLIDTANAKSGITDEVITFEPITPFDISPHAQSYNGVSLKPTHYSKYCYNRLDSFCKGYEACSAVVAGINTSISSNDTSNSQEDAPPETITDEIILHGEKRNEIGKVDFVVPLKSDLSYYRFKKGTTYTFTLTTSSSRGFSGSAIYAALGTNGNINPGTSRNILRSTQCTKQDDTHSFVFQIKGDGNQYSHLCIGLSGKDDYDRVYNYVFNASIATAKSITSKSLSSPVASDTSSETVDVLNYLKSDGETGNIRDDLLGKYQQYILLLSGRMQWLNEQIQKMEAEQSSLMDRINEIKDVCDMENCLNDYKQKHNISHNLWHELCSFKRQDTYRNENLIGEGVNDVDLMKNIESLIKRANEEIEKACNIVYSVRATIDNLLVMPEFEKFWDKFTLGNYIHMMIDGHVHTMRLISITYNYGDLSKCSVDFSDIVTRKSSENDIKDILSQAASIATTAKTVARQAEEGASAKLSIQEIKNDALNIANSRIITADNQNFTMDRYGITGRMVDEISDEVSPEQIRIINNLLCFTDNAWGNTKTALGKITYLNPETHEYESSYGLIGDTVIGNLMMSERLIATNGNGSVYIDGTGITLDGGAIRWKGEKIPIIKVETYYLTTKTAANTPLANDQGWKTELPSMTDGLYLWQKTVEIDGANNQKVTISCLGGTDNIDSIETQYYPSDSSASLQNGYWSNIIPTYTIGSGIVKYIWTRECITYKSGDKSYVNERYDSALTNSIFKYGTFKDKVNSALTGNAATEIGSDYIISPKIGGGYLYLVNGNNSITLNPSAGSVLSNNGKKSSSDYMFEIISNNLPVLKVDKTGNMQLGHGTIGNSNTVLFSPNGIKSNVPIADSSGINNWALTANNTFGVTTDGKLYAKDAQITGTVHANSGTFSGSITSNSLNMTGGSLSIPIDTSNRETPSTQKITVYTNDSVSDTLISNGSILNNAGNNYFRIAFNSGSSYLFEKNVSYSFVITISSSYGFHSTNLMAAFGNSGNFHPGDGTCVYASSCTKRDMHTFSITFNGDGNTYSHLFIGLSNQNDYDRNYQYSYSMYKQSSGSKIAISPDGISFSQNKQTGKLSINNAGTLCSDVNFYAPNLQEKEWKVSRKYGNNIMPMSTIFSTANELNIMVTAYHSNNNNYVYSWFVTADQVKWHYNSYNDGFHLISGYSNDPYKGFVEVLLNTEIAYIRKCIVAGNDYTSDAMLTINYR